MKDISLVSVIYSKNSYLKFKKNYELVNKTNDTDRWIWYVGINNNLDIRGIDLISNNNIKYFNGVDINYSIPPSIRGSYNHGECLNKILYKINSKYLLIMDYDFYIIKNNWVNKVIRYMEESDIYVFGAPWHPKWITKYRDFPCVHFMILNLDEINKQLLDFCPDYDFQKLAIKNSFKTKIPNFIKNFLNNNYFRKLSLVGTSKDTGFKVYELLKGKKNELLTPVFNVLDHNYNNIILTIDKLIPQNKNLSLNRKAYEFQPFLISKKDKWEQFFWKREPFGFHIRGEMNKDNDDIDCLNKNISNLIRND